MTISYVGSGSADSNTVSIPTHQQWDLLLAFAYRNNTNSVATIPSDWNLLGWVSNNTNSLLCGWRIAQSGSETFGTWTNANQVAVGVYRSDTKLLAAAAQATNTGTVGSGGNVLYLLQVAVSPVTNKWLVWAFGHRSNDTDIQTAPTGQTNRTSIAGASAGEMGFHDSNGNYSSWSNTNYTLTAGTSSGYAVRAVEIVETPILLSSLGGGTSRPVSPFLSQVIA